MNSPMGFVYVLTNESMPGMVKIGYTTDLAEDRAKGIYRTGVPTPFHVAFRVISMFPKLLEKMVHAELETYRVEKRREFFRVSPEHAIEVILFNRQFIDGIGAYEVVPKLLMNKGDHALLSMKAGQLFVVFSYSEWAVGKQEILDIWQAHHDGDTLELFVTDAKYTSSFSRNDPFSLIDPLPYLNRTNTAKNDDMNGKERLVPGDRLLWIDDTDPEKFRSALFEMNDYCQVISRTRHPTLNAHGVPLVLNVVTRELESAPIKTCVKQVLSRGLPKVIASKPGSSETEKMLHEFEELPVENWLPALIKKKKRKSNGQ